MALAAPTRRHDPSPPYRVRPPAAPPARAAKESDSSTRSTQLAVWLAVFGLIWAAHEVVVGKLYTPRSTLGFYLGVTGTLMMVALLTYPLRKHVRWMQRWGPLKHWFRLHMILGIAGPTLVLFHSTFHIRSPNAAVALLSMLVVVISGVIGRFVYQQIHYGLYGSRATLATLRDSVTGRSDEAQSRLHFAPRVKEWLHRFEQEAVQSDRSLGAQWLSLLTLWVSSLAVAFRCRREIRKLFRAGGHPEFHGGAPEACRLITRYLNEVKRVAHFSTYERLFALWHVFHIPLIYLLAASTLFHVIAVYMY